MHTCPTDCSLGTYACKKIRSMERHLSVTWSRSRVAMCRITPDGAPACPAVSSCRIGRQPSDSRSMPSASDRPSTRRSRSGSIRSADAVDENIDAAPLLRDAVNDGLHTFCCADVRLHEHRWLLVLRKRGARGSRDRGAAQGEPAHDGFSHALRATGHQHPLAFELAGLSNARIRRSH